MNSPDTMPTTALILFTRYPRPGRCKTRLIPALGPAGAAELHRRMAERVLAAAREFCRNKPAHWLTVAFCDGSLAEMRDWLGSDLDLVDQGPGRLGDRMLRALRRALDGGAAAALLAGTDCPGIDAAVFRQARKALDWAEVVFGPSADGGYYLVGLRRIADLFTGLSYGGRGVLDAAEGRARDLGLGVQRVGTLHDIDEPDDLVHLPGDLGSPA